MMWIILQGGGAGALQCLAGRNPMTAFVKHLVKGEALLHHLRLFALRQGVPGFFVGVTEADESHDLWMALKFHAVDGYTASIERDLSLADHLAKRVRQSSDLQLITEPSLSIVCFRFAPMPLRNDEEQLNQLNKRLLEAVQLSGNAFLSSTTINSAFCLRACVINHRSTEQDIDSLIAHIKQIGEMLQSE